MVNFPAMFEDTGGYIGSPPENDSETELFHAPSSSTNGFTLRSPPLSSAPCQYLILWRMSVGKGRKGNRSKVWKHPKIFWPKDTKQVGTLAKNIIMNHDSISIILNHEKL